MDVAESLVNRGALNGVTCAIIATYSEQKKEYIGRMMRLSEGLNIAWKEMAKVATVDSKEGHEADVVDLD
ncbi:hypothetical protein HFD88_008575 [Aspergillus terreus]|nr:hypothetical protein HFD88_008575 [Aspergillus terreus]